MNTVLETKRTIKSDIELITEWLKQQPHLPDSWDEQWISTFYRQCGYSLEKCKTKIDSYFTLKNVAQEFFTNRNVAHFNKISKYLNMFLLPKLIMPNSYKVMMFSSKDTSYHDYNVIEAMMTFFMVMDARCLSGDEESLGDVYICDLSTSYHAHMLKSVTPAQWKTYITCTQKAFPTKIKTLHFLNVSPVLQTFVKLIKVFLKEKLRDRIYVHSDLESLFKHVSKDMLPEEYGGTAGTVASLREETFNLLNKFQMWFIRTEAIKSDETRRPGKAVNAEELFGIDGSFKQLTID